jgi:xylonate dehydratase
VGPEALAGGPLGKLVDGDIIAIRIDREQLQGSIDLVGVGDEGFSPQRGAEVLAARALRPDLAPEEQLPAATRLWAALQNAGGGTWGGCVYDVDRIVEALEAGQQALAARK